MTWLSAIEATGVAAGDMAAPQARWGTDEVQTDARGAVLLEGGRTTPEIILVNGSRAAVDDHQIFTVPARVPLLRAQAHGWPGTCSASIGSGLSLSRAES